MLISEIISKLQKLQSEIGDTQVLVTDGFDAVCYRGDYEIAKWQDDDGRMVVDIGIGGCRE
jgi:hypothetical protein